MVARVLRDFGGAARARSSCSTTRPTTATRTSRSTAARTTPTREDQGAQRETPGSGSAACRRSARKVGIKTVYDLSATPFYLKGSGYNEGYIFPWVVSDFSLMDAIESGIVKIPRVPVDDDADRRPASPTCDLWDHIGDELPEAAVARPTSTRRLGAARRARRRAAEPVPQLRRRPSTHWEADARAARRAAAGVHRRLPQHDRLQAGLRLDRRHGDRAARRRRCVVARQARRCSATSRTAQWLDRPRTILVDSAQLESGEALTTSSSRPPRSEIEEFKAEYRRRNPGARRRQAHRRGPAARGDEHRRQEGQARRAHPLRRLGLDAHRGLGRQHRHPHPRHPGRSAASCSASRSSAAACAGAATPPNDDGLFEPEYAEVYGVPFAFIPTDARIRPEAAAAARPSRCGRWTEPGRTCAIKFPKLDGYRVEMPDEQLHVRPRARHSAAPRSQEPCATWTDVEGVVGERRGDRPRRGPQRPRRRRSPSRSPSRCCDRKSRRRTTATAQAVAVPAARRRSPSTGSTSASRSPTTRPPGCCCSPQAARPRPQRPSIDAIVRAGRRPQERAAADAPAVRPGRARPTTSTSSPARSSSDADEVARQPRRARRRQGQHVGGGARRALEHAPSVVPPT